MYAQSRGDDVPFAMLGVDLSEQATSNLLLRWLAEAEVRVRSFGA